MKRKRQRSVDLALSRDEDRRLCDELEDMLVEEVRHFWRETRRGPHDECDCYDWNRYMLNVAVSRLRAWRKLGSYQPW